MLQEHFSGGCVTGAGTPVCSGIKTYTVWVTVYYVRCFLQVYHMVEGLLHCIHWEVANQSKQHTKFTKMACRMPMAATHYPGYNLKKNRGGPSLLGVFRLRPRLAWPGYPRGALARRARAGHLF